eukprot:CAMPEP_0114343266 /NCGR_PEP_ID=MMETSP0101-20121206/10458_1 /TAXON_ID=38822 ORGANISM="Pteridomonas danica, Strain PT" /NCGR_SAMPLE_ID=MMETSP0101 /ASSEMBLY_ACC=CAM_ASM_000211 /LENGTH=438 /DNA_ID=CAMNT_0001477863 /DNA_START=6 /DNA_END=1319 /DNA_ORIENTATION=-
MAESTLLKLDLPSAASPLVGQLFYQPISRQNVPVSTEVSWLIQRALAAAIDGEALILAKTFRDLKKLGISPADEAFTGLGGVTPLHLAVEANSPATVCVLVDHGCDVNVRDRLGDTPAHTAARLNFIECIRILGSPQALADFSILNDDNLTPSELACRGGHSDAVKVMQELQEEDETEHMAKRSIAEAARQRKMVRMKETLYGRPFTSFEGGRDFEIPVRALLNDDHVLRVASNVRAFASVPAIIDAGLKKALSVLSKERTKLLLKAMNDDDDDEGKDSDNEDEEDEEDAVKDDDVESPGPQNDMKEKNSIILNKNNNNDDDVHNENENKLSSTQNMINRNPRNLTIVTKNPSKDNQDHNPKNSPIQRTSSSSSSNYASPPSPLSPLSPLSPSSPSHHHSKPVVDWDDFDDEVDCFIPGRIASSRWIDFSKGRPPDLG